MPAIDIKAYKMKLILDIINSETIVKGLDSKKPNVYSPEDLLMKNIFPYLHVNFIETVADSYILIGVDQANINSRNPTFADLRITIWVMSHVNHQIMAVGDIAAARNDYVAEEISKVLDGNMNYGYGVLELVASRENILNEDYQYRELIFHTVDFTTRADSKIRR